VEGIAELVKKVIGRWVANGDGAATILFGCLGESLVTELGVGTVELAVPSGVPPEE